MTTKDLLDTMFSDAPKWWHVWNPLTGFLGGVAFMTPAWLSILPGWGWLFPAWSALAMVCLGYGLYRADKEGR